MKFRLKKYPKGWIVEYQERRLLKSVWKHVTHYAGSKSPFYYSDPESARQGAARELTERMSFDCQFSNDLLLWV